MPSAYSRLLCLVLAFCLVSCGSPRKTADITILGTLTGQGITEMEQILAPFIDRTGITVDYQGTDAFTTLLPLEVAAGNPPDLALFPQPGLMQNLVEEGKLIPLDTLVDPALFQEALTEQWLNLGQIRGQLYGLPQRVYLKGLVWYRPDRFAAKGYTVPNTWEELQALDEKIMAAGETPWCMGLESGESSGWVGTDWIEDILLRQSGADLYDRWVNHQIPFTDPAIETAFKTFGTIALNPKAVRGGTVGAMSTSFGDAPLPLFDNPPGCYLHYQSNFISSFFPSTVDLDQGVAIFPLPPFAQNPAGRSSIVVGAVQLGVLRDTPAVRALLGYLLSPEPQEIWAGFSGHLSPYRQVGTEAYADRLSRQQVEILQNAQVIRFDASDAMPGEVGTGTFWVGVMDYLSGVELQTVLQEIESSWPK